MQSIYSFIAKKIHNSRVWNVAATRCFKFVIAADPARSHDRRFVVYISYYYYCKTYINKY